MPQHVWPTSAHQQTKRTNQPTYLPASLLWGLKLWGSYRICVPTFGVCFSPEYLLKPTFTSSGQTKLDHLSEDAAIFPEWSLHWRLFFKVTSSVIIEWIYKESVSKGIRTSIFIRNKNQTVQLTNIFFFCFLHIGLIYKINVFSPHKSVDQVIP